MMRITPLVTVLAVGLAGLATLVAGGCGKKSQDPSCEQVVDHAFGLLTKQGGIDASKQESVRAEAVAQCKAHGYTAEVRRCMVVAPSIETMGGCMGKATDGDPARARSSEAKLMVKKMYEGARAYYEEEHIGRGEVNVLPKQFPGPAVGPTPPLGACCQAPEKKCAPDIKQWSDPVWQALHFVISDPHYYSYRFISDDHGFTAGAYGDLDCDGTYSTFEIIGSVGPDGTITGGSGVFTKNELE
jgi:hypothetical protein